MSYSNLWYVRHTRISTFLAVFSLMPSLCQANSTDADLLQSLLSRQSVLEAHLLDASRCLGERLDGMIQFNAGRRACGEDIRTLADAENADRRALHKLIAADLGTTADAVGRQRAERYQDRYPPGVMREIQLAGGQTTWWDGYPPAPGIDSVSRVLALDGVRVYAEPSGTARVVREGIQQYEAFGVVDSTQADDGQVWYQVTEAYVPRVKPRGWSPKTLGWMAATDAIPWRRAVVMKFTAPFNRPKTLFYRSKESLLELIRAEPDVRAARIATQRAQFGQDRSAASWVIAQEPKVNPGQERAIFYPVLDFYDRSLDLRVDNTEVRLLEVAARTRTGGAGKRGSAGKVAVDIVFVMDTTHSMAPYLRDVLSATEQFVENNSTLDLQFGFVGYQDAGSGFDYQAKAFTGRTLPVNEFVPILRRIKARPTPVASDDFPEAGLNGVNLAIESTQWRENTVRVLFLIGDAPGKETTTLTLRGLSDKARTRDIRIFAFHIAGTNSKSYDAESRKQYKELSAFYAGPRDSTDPRYYFTSLDAASSGFMHLVLERFEEARRSNEDIEQRRITGEPLPAVAPGSLSELIFQQATLLLADPDLPDKEVTGWVADKVLTKPSRYALEPMVLFNESELDELAARVKELKEVGEQALRAEDITTIDFWEMVNTNTRMTMVDPAAVDFRDAFSVPLGIDRLPYDSEIMRTGRDEFRNKDRVRSFVRSMKDKLAHYEDLRRQRSNKQVWKKLSRGADEWVVGVALYQLP